MKEKLILTQQKLTSIKCTDHLKNNVQINDDNIKYYSRTKFRMSKS